MNIQLAAWLQAVPGRHLRLERHGGQWSVTLLQDESRAVCGRWTGASVREVLARCELSLIEG